MSTPDFYLIAILFLLFSVYCLDTLTDALNLTRLRDQLPDEFKDLYDPKKYEQSLNYQRDNCYFEFFHRTFSFLVLIAFIVLGGFDVVDQFARSLTENSILAGLTFVGALSLLSMILELPFSIYSTFVIEEKYGFNKTTPSTFVLDIFKGMAISAILGGIVFSGILYFFTTAGSKAWLYSWLGITLFQLLVAYLAPAIILPLFNKYSPLEQGPLRDAIEAFAMSRNFKLSGIYTMDSSKRSTKGNAFFTGFGKFRRLVLFDTLITKHTTEELVAVLAHEIGHFEKKHILKSMILSILGTAVLFYTFSFFINSPTLFAAFRMQNLSVYASLVFIGLLFSPVLRILSIVPQAISRKHEFEADAFAVDTYGRSEILVSALKKLSVDSLSHLTPHPIKVALDYTHPPILERIRALRVHGTKQVTRKSG